FDRHSILVSHSALQRARSAWERELISRLPHSFQLQPCLLLLQRPNVGPKKLEADSWKLKAVFHLPGQRLMRQAQALDKSRDRFWRGFRSRALDQLDYGAANDRGIGESSHLREMLRIGDAESHSHRQPLSSRSGPSPDAGHQGRGIGGHALLRAGDANARNSID